MAGDLRQLAVVSGKGGTGKTSVVSSLAALAGRSVLADCDVDAPNLHLVAKPLTTRSFEFWGRQVAVLDPTRCRVRASANADAGSGPSSEAR